MTDRHGATITVRFSENGVHLEARPDTVGTDPEELRLLAWMGTEQRRQRIATLQDNCRHACEMLLTAETAGSA